MVLRRASTTLGQMFSLLSNSPRWRPLIRPRAFGFVRTVLGARRREACSWHNTPLGISDANSGGATGLLGGLENVDPALVCNPSPLLLEGAKVLGGKSLEGFFCLPP